ncbi:unnamed protein product [Porites lobata]|uniref:Uncharacterized protein n=1 Tax=Porites lobata TaxID=104759 RepID=A0ABN8RAX0_9CNID|nr:unnamed protein product [Porites lobata]
MDIRQYYSNRANQAQGLHSVHYRNDMYVIRLLRCAFYLLYLGVSKTKTLGLKRRPHGLNRRPPELKPRPLGLKRRPPELKRRPLGLK